MLNIQYDIQRRDVLKDLLLRLRHEETVDSIQVALDSFIEDTGMIGLLLIKQSLLNEDEEITVEDAQKMSTLYNDYLEDESSDPLHPISLFKQENALFQATLQEIAQLLTALEQEESSESVKELQQKVYRLGEFHKHFHRKEKLLFPILERYGHTQPGRIMWGNDDQIRALYLGIKRRVDQYPDTNWSFVKKRYGTFQEKFEQMIYEEEHIVFPMLQILFKDTDWQAVAEESEAFGYAMIEVEDVWTTSFEPEESIQPSQSTEEHLRFGGGYLTTEEANLILNHLPLEITFVDKNNVFKYFNEMTAASEMMLVRTPISIGRNVSNCHPPKSLRKVMTLIRDLVAQRRTTESMWFKKQGQYIHLTYKALFNDQGEYMGILEYVQDIQPFFELPEEVKMGLSPIVE